MVPTEAVCPALAVIRCNGSRATGCLLSTASCRAEPADEVDWAGIPAFSRLDVVAAGPATYFVAEPRKNFEVRMVQTYGLTHINLAVRDLRRALRFYEQVFGLREYGRGDGLVHTQASEIGR